MGNCCERCFGRLDKRWVIPLWCWYADTEARTVTDERTVAAVTYLSSGSVNESVTRCTCPVGVDNTLEPLSGADVVHVSRTAIYRSWSWCLSFAVFLFWTVCRFHDLTFVCDVFNCSSIESMKSSSAHVIAWSRSWWWRVLIIFTYHDNHALI